MHSFIVAVNRATLNFYDASIFIHREKNKQKELKTKVIIRPSSSDKGENNKFKFSVLISELIKCVPVSFSKLC